MWFPDHTKKYFIRLIKLPLLITENHILLLLLYGYYKDIQKTISAFSSKFTNSLIQDVVNCVLQNNINIKAYLQIPGVFSLARLFKRLRQYF